MVPCQSSAAAASLGALPHQVGAPSALALQHGSLLKVPPDCKHLVLYLCQS